MLAQKWVFVLRSEKAAGRAGLFDFALPFLDVTEVTRLVLDERIDVPEIGIGDSEAVHGIVHAYVDPDTPLPPDAVDLIRSFQADAYLMDETVTTFADDGLRSSSEHENDGFWRIGLLHRRADRSRREFVDMWRTDHPSVVRTHHPSAYQLRQAAVIRELVERSAPLDGIFQAYSPTFLDVRNRRFASDESVDIVMDDLVRFSDQSKTELMYGHRMTLRGSTPA